jgi:hypothetical protein
VILAKRADGKLACMIGGVGMSVCRQVGKTYLFGGMTFGLAVQRPGFLAIWSAHHARTADFTFRDMQAFAKRRRIAPYIDAVYRGSGDEEIRFLNESRILFGARERGFGRGIPGVDMIVSDEAQIMSEKALDAQLATMNTSDFGLAVYIGTPPRPDDPSEAFTRMRTEAWSGTLEDAVWIEIGAEPGTDPNDRKLWPVWNPSHPKRTPVESILRLQRKLKDESFIREGMGTWDKDGDGVFPGTAWRDQSRPEVDPRTGKALSQITGRVHVALDVAWDRTGCALAVAGKRDDGTIQGEIVEPEQPITIATLAAMAAAVVKAQKAPGVWLEPSSAAGSLVPALEALGVKVLEMRGEAVSGACGAVYDGIMDGSIVHLGQGTLDSAVSGTQWRGQGEARRWDRRQGANISPFMAFTFAVRAAQGRNRGGSGRVVVLDN